MKKNISFDKFFQDQQLSAGVPIDHKKRLLGTVMRQFKEGGPQEESFKKVFATTKSFDTFAKDLEDFVGKIPDEIVQKTRVFVTNNNVASHKVSPVGEHFLAKSPYTVVLEKDTAKKNAEYVLRVILNVKSQVDRFQEFFTELGLGTVMPQTIGAILRRVDLAGGITVRLVTFSYFKNKYGERKDWFYFSDDEMFGLFEENELVVTNSYWRKSVRINMPDGAKPWAYHYTKDEAGHRIEATFRLNLYGALWYTPRTE